MNAASIKNAGQISVERADWATGDYAATEPRRVRTPGKHIVLFVVAAALMLSLSTSVLNSGEFAASRDTRNVIRTGEISYAAFDPILVDLLPDQRGRITYLKLTPSIVADSDEAFAEIEARREMIRERFTFMLRALSPEDLDDSEDMARLKDELAERVNIVIAPYRATEVVVNELVIQ
jgi:flagellar basal body-associated protein FliL